MNSDIVARPEREKPHLLWVLPGRLEAMLSAASRLETTQRLRRLGWQVTLAESGPAGIKMIDGVEVMCIPNPDKYLLRQVVYHLRILRYILANWSKIDLIMFSQPSAIWLFPLKGLRLLRGDSLPLLVMDTRTVPMEDMSKATFKDKLRSGFYNWMNDLANRFAVGQTAITRRMAEWVQIPADNLWGVWTSGADLEDFGPALAARRWPTGDEPLRLVYIGVLHYERNLLSLCQAVELANAEGMRFELSLTGEGTQQKELEQFARQTNGHIQVNPPIPHNQVPNLLSKMHIGAIPFPDEVKYRVSSPLKLFEFMAAGLPILATRIVCHTDIIQDGKFAFWAEDHTPQGLLAALRLAWSAREQLPSMGVEAAAAAKAYSWDESAQKLNDALMHGLQIAKQNARAKKEKRTV